MYHIKEDKRCLKSAERIGEAFRAILAEKPLSEITVTDIQKVSGVGRSTFYRLFDNIDDVLLYIAEEEFNGMITQYKELSWSGFTEHFIGNIMSESRGLVNIVSAGKTHLISKALRNNLTQAAETDNYMFDNLSRYMIAMFVGGCISLVTAWDENGREESIDELARLMQQAFNYGKIEKILRRPAKAKTDD
jgi:AcrR family transcriptional regulator